MSKFTYRIEFGLEMEDDKPILTCTCDHRYEITPNLFGRSKELFSCPHCNKLWHLEKNRENKTILLINPKISCGIYLKKKDNNWIYAC